VDLIVSPTTGVVATETLPFSSIARDGNGLSDLSQQGDIMRFVQLANLTGCPAISVPCGMVENSSSHGNSPSLPVGLQFMANWWAEDLLLKVALWSERTLAEAMPNKIQAAIHFDLLDVKPGQLELIRKHLQEHVNGLDDSLKKHWEEAWQ
jgi:Asp-tRNA(Asn)/Glu-tRNA(Gln) amidotransferase A subunit family amidase